MLLRRQSNAVLLPMLAALALALAGAARGESKVEESAAPLRHPEWSRSAVIYEVNLRQFTAEGTLAAFDRELPRLRELGIGIVWLMPVQPIGVKHRKGRLGSYYSIRDYRAVDPALGTLDDFRRVVTDAHALGMKVILDWVANHTAWDHPWTTEHPDWYQRDAKGRLHYYEYISGKTHEKWTDVVGLDYRAPALRDAMLEAMKFWLNETGIDGFRCDVAGRVPVDFWERARAELDAIKPVFMLAEADDPALHRAAFDMTYNWGLLELMRAVAAGRKTAADLADALAHPDPRFPPDAYRMNFTSNHDVNSWAGTDRELFGDGFKAFAVLAAMWPGMPLIYGGQEAGVDKRLKFFERDPIDWSHPTLAAFYRSLIQFKAQHPALWNGTAGGSVDVVDSGNPAVLAFVRRQGVDRVGVAINLSPQPQRFSHSLGADHLGPWQYVFAPVDHYQPPASAPH